jgi:ABC-type transport system involved in multi-copper enzyme maturation permease subunit
MSAVIIIAKSTLREFGRQSGVLLLLGLAVVATGGGWFWVDFNFEANDTQFLLNFGWGVQGIVASLVVIVAVAQSFDREHEQQTAILLRTRSVKPWAIMLGKSGSVWTVAAGFVVLSNAWLVILGSIADGRLPLALMVEVAGLKLVKLGIVVSVAVWFASYGRSVLFVVLASMGVVVLGHLHPLIAGANTWLSAVRFLVPDLQCFERTLSADGVQIGVDWGDLGLKCLYAAWYAGVFLILGSVAWKRREY